MKYGIEPDSIVTPLIKISVGKYDPPYVVD